MKGKLYLLLGLVCLALSTPASSQRIADGRERILSFRSDIIVHADSSMTVYETISVVSTGREIRRGIYRDFPTRYKDELGNRYVVGFEDIQVLRDNEPEPYHIEDRENGKRVYIGDPKVFLSPGYYTYTLSYKTNRQLGFFEGHDELYWNVTGNGWSFPIVEAMAVVTLPEGISADEISLDGYTGRQGYTARDFEADVDSAGRAVFSTTEPLSPREGLTIVVCWPKGFVAEPTSMQKTGYFLRDNQGILIGFLGLLAVLAYYIITWAKVGNDPDKGTIIPLFEPPESLSPAAVRFINRMGYDNKAFTAAVISMAVKGYVKIENEGDEYTLTRDKADDSVLTLEEKVLARSLIDSYGSITLTNVHHAKVAAAIKGVKKLLKSKYGREYFSTNSAYLLPGVAVSLAVLAFGAIRMPMRETAERGALIGLVFWLALWTFGTAVLVKRAVRGWQAASADPKKAVGAGWLTFFAVPFVGAELVVIGIVTAMSSFSLIVLVVLFAAVNFLFYGLLKCTTIRGRRLMDRIEGFRMYLSVAEQDRLNTLNPPERTPELFEAFLPYALALDVEQAWSEKFAEVLSQAGVDGQPYQPGWYSGTSSWDSTEASGFTSGLVGSLSGAIASSSTAPGSSSGFSSGGGGGGSSGGGGGGGGGGGW